jgi:hypothetical protein
VSLRLCGMAIQHRLSVDAWYTCLVLGGSYRLHGSLQCCAARPPRPHSVLAVLAPLLEGMGALRVPGAERTVHAAPGFCFVAAINGARYAGRQALAAGLRSRFVELQVPDFERDELARILLRRSAVLTEHGSCRRYVAVVKGCGTRPVVKALPA